jgi:hypothetical protein
MPSRSLAKSFERQRKSLSEYLELMSFLNEEYLRAIQTRQARAGWDWYSLQQNYRDKVSSSRSQLQNNTFGLIYLLDLLKSVRKQVEMDSFCEDTVHRLLLYFGTADFNLGVRLLSVLEAYARTDGAQNTIKRLGSDPIVKGENKVKLLIGGEPNSSAWAKEAGISLVSVPEGLKPRVLAEIDEDIKKFQFLSRQADLAGNVNLEPEILPDERAMNRLARYETAIERQLYKALSELERRQEARLRGSAPAPIRPDLNRE